MSRFQRAAQDPERAQADRLKALLAANRATSYGREHGFARVDSPAAYQRLVPVVDYESISPFLDRVAGGESGVLTREPVRMMERSSGSTARNKLIPYTAALLSEFSAATNAWLFDLHRSQRRLWGTRSYWSVSPVARRRECTSGGLPIGFEDDTEYFGVLARWALRRMMAVPASVARLNSPHRSTW